MLLSIILTNVLYHRDYSISFLSFYTCLLLCTDLFLRLLPLQVGCFREMRKDGGRLEPQNQRA